MYPANFLVPPAPVLLPPSLPSVEVQGEHPFRPMAQEAQPTLALEVEVKHRIVYCINAGFYITVFFPHVFAVFLAV